MSRNENEADDNDPYSSSAQQQHNDGNSSAERFSTNVANLLMSAEELRGSLASVQDVSDTSAAATTTSKTKSKFKVETHHVLQWQQDVEGLLYLLDVLARCADDTAAVNNLEEDMFRHCQQKAMEIIQATLETCMHLQEIDDEEYDNNSTGIPLNDLRQDGQRAIARLAEVNLLVLENAARRTIATPCTNCTTENSCAKNQAEIVQSYVAYQRQVLRQRAKPAIARLVQARRQGIDVMATTATANANAVVVHHDDDDHNDGTTNDDIHNNQHAPPIMMQQHHGPVIAAVLGQAAALIHPLLSWQASLPPLHNESGGLVRALLQLCSSSVATLDEQAQSLVKTVSDWFWQDMPILDEWMKQSATAAHSTNDDLYKDDCAGWMLERRQLGVLDALVEEMAFSCQVQARYQSLVASTVAQQQDQNATNIIQHELLPEWTWKYAALERFLAMQQWQSALMLATSSGPVSIVVGGQVQVPSVVEDAQYLSVRALERAASTQSNQAIGTVAHAMSHDVWSTEEMTRGGVHQALLERRGCWTDHNSHGGGHSSEKTKVVEEAPNSGSAFASALMDALDEDLGPSSQLSSNHTNNKTKSVSPPKPPVSPPRSGNFLSNIVGGGVGADKMQQIHLDAEFCAMNGMHAACAACRSLVGFLDALLQPPEDDDDYEGCNSGVILVQDEKAKALIQLAREELSRYAEAYQLMLTALIHDSLESSCGSTSEAVALRGLCFHDLYAFLEQENYNINAHVMTQAESDERLDRELIEPLRSSRFLSQLSSKCEADVLLQVGEAVVSTLVQLFLEVLWKTNNKKFSDWGSLLLAKQVRLVQACVSKILSPDGGASEGVMTPHLLQRWERLSQVLTVLQLEKPSDWLAYNSSFLSPEELKATLCLRVDFSNDAIQAVVAQVISKMAQQDKSFSS